MVISFSIPVDVSFTYLLVLFPVFPLTETNAAVNVTRHIILFKKMDKAFAVVLVSRYCDISNDRNPSEVDRVCLAHLLQPFIKARQDRSSRQAPGGRN